MTESVLPYPGPSYLRQLACPHGRLAPKIAQVMNAGNRYLNELAIGALHLRDADRVLDVGFGGGIGIRELFRNHAGIVVSGIDPSEEMVQSARETLADRIEAGQLEIVHGSVESLPWEDGRFACAMSVNTVFFWRDVEAGLGEIRRVLRAGGRLVFGNRALWALRLTELDKHGYHLLGEEQLSELLRQAGFADVSVTEGNDPLCGGAVLISGRCPAAP